MTPAYVDHLSWAVASGKHSVEDSVAAGRTRTGADELLGAGFRFHHVCAADESAYDLARAAVAPIGDGLDGVDAIVYATCIPANANLAPAHRFAGSGDVKHLMDFPASRLQADLGLDRAAVFGLNQQACTAMLGSLRLGRALLAAEADLHRVLCVTADRFPPGAVHEQAYSLISDGAAAAVVSRAPAGYRIVAVHHLTNGALVEADDDETVGAWFPSTRRLVTEVLVRAGLEVADIDWVVPQNTDPRAWTVLSRLLGLDPARVLAPTLADVGHVISADNVVNLAAVEQLDVVASGDRLLLVMAGYGMNWQATLLEKV